MHPLMLMRHNEGEYSIDKVIDPGHVAYGSNPQQKSYHSEHACKVNHETVLFEGETCTNDIVKYIWQNKKKQ